MPRTRICSDDWSGHMSPATNKEHLILWNTNKENFSEWSFPQTKCGIQMKIELPQKIWSRSHGTKFLESRQMLWYRGFNWIMVDLLCLINHNLDLALYTSYLFPLYMWMINHVNSISATLWNQYRYPAGLLKIHAGIDTQNLIHTISIPIPWNSFQHKY